MCFWFQDPFQWIQFVHVCWCTFAIFLFYSCCSSLPLVFSATITTVLSYSCYDSFLPFQWRSLLTADHFWVIPRPAIPLQPCWIHQTVWVKQSPSELPESLLRTDWLHIPISFFFPASQVGFNYQPQLPSWSLFPHHLKPIWTRLTENLSKKLEVEAEKEISDQIFYLQHYESRSKFIWYMFMDTTWWIKKMFKFYSLSGNMWVGMMG